MPGLSSGSDRRSLDEAVFGTSVPSTSPPNGDPLSIAYRGGPGDIIGLTALNAPLNIITLTLYRFWGKTRVREHVLARIEINGEPLEYVGTGWELFRGFLIVLFLLLLPALAAVYAAQIFAPQFALLVIFPVYFLFIFLAQMAVYTARRYRFSRSTWRGVRFFMSGSAADYAWAALGYGFLTSLTFGWYAPAAEMRLRRRLWAETGFGDKEFHITVPDQGLAGPVYGPFALLWVAGAIAYVGFLGLVGYLGAAGYYEPQSPDPVALLAIYMAALGLVAVVALFAAPYQAALMRRTADIVGYDHARFDLDAATPSLFWLNFGNILILTATLGFGQPIASVRTFRYIIRRLKPRGLVDIETITQAKDRGPRSGEGLADAFDIGGF